MREHHAGFTSSKTCPSPSCLSLTLSNLTRFTEDANIFLRSSLSYNCRFLLFIVEPTNSLLLLNRVIKMCGFLAVTTLLLQNLPYKNLKWLTLKTL